MKLSIIKDRDELREHMLEMVQLLEEGKEVQIMVSPIEGLIRTAAQNRFYRRCLQVMSLHSGMSPPELEEEMKARILGDPDCKLEQLSIEEFSAFLDQLIFDAEQNLGCKLS